MGGTPGCTADHYVNASFKPYSRLYPPKKAVFFQYKVRHLRSTRHVALDPKTGKTRPNKITSRGLDHLWRGLDQPVWSVDLGKLHFLTKQDLDLLQSLEETRTWHPFSGPPAASERKEPWKNTTHSCMTNPIELEEKKTTIPIPIHSLLGIEFTEFPEFALWSSLRSAFPALPASRMRSLAARRRQTPALEVQAMTRRGRPT